MPFLQPLHPLLRLLQFLYGSHLCHDGLHFHAIDVLGVEGLGFALF